MNCSSCTNPVSKGHKQCRTCWCASHTKTKGNCQDCNKRLLPGVVSEGGKRCRKCWRKNLIDNRLFWQNEKWLREHYLEEKMCVPQISRLVDAYCSRVEWWLNKFSIPMRTQGEWKLLRPMGGRTRLRGYSLIWMPTHPRANKSRPYIPEHILIMEKNIGRYISKKENVHHKNGLRSDNRIENLQLFPSTSAHKTYEGFIQMFAKQLLWGELKPERKEELLNLFRQFLSRNGQDISA